MCVVQVVQFASILKEQCFKLWESMAMYHSWQTRADYVDGFSFVPLLTPFATLLHHKIKN